MKGSLHVWPDLAWFSGVEVKRGCTIHLHVISKNPIRNTSSFMFGMICLIIQTLAKKICETLKELNFETGETRIQHSDNGGRDEVWKSRNILPGVRGLGRPHCAHLSRALPSVPASNGHLRVFTPQTFTQIRTYFFSSVHWPAQHFLKT